MHKTIEPTILYFGTPVALISTLNADGTANLAPMSSAWWLGWSCMLGLGQMGQTSENLERTRQCVINLPSVDMVSNVDRLAMTTGRDPVPEKKLSWGYRHEADKFGLSGLTPVPSHVVAPPRVLECPVQMEGVVHDVRPFGKNVSANAFEVHIEKLHVDESLLAAGNESTRPHIDPTRWRPLIMSFCRFFGLSGEAHPSRLAESSFMKAMTAPLRLVVALLGLASAAHSLAAQSSRAWGFTSARVDSYTAAFVYTGYGWGPLFGVGGVMFNRRSQYSELVGGVGARVRPDSNTTHVLVAAVAEATDSRYFQAIYLPSFKLGGLDVSATLQWYAPIDASGAAQFYVTPLSATHSISRLISIGATYELAAQRGISSAHFAGPTVRLALAGAQLSVDAHAGVSNGPGKVRFSFQSFY